MPSNVIGPIDPGADILNDLSDVNCANPNLNDTLCFDGTNWICVPKTNQDQALNEHTDVTITNVQDLDTLCYDQASGMWINVPKSNQPFGLDDLTDVDCAAANSGDELCYDGTNWVCQPKSNVAHSIDDHTDVDCPSPVAGQVLVYDGTNFVCQAPAGSSINDLLDVNCPAPADGHELCYDGVAGEWVCQPKTNQPIALDDLTNVNCPTPTTGDVIVYDGTNFVCQAPATFSIDDLTDVDCAAAATGDELCFDGTNWVCQPKSNVDHGIDDHTDVTITNVQDGETLCYDSATSMWINVPKENQDQALDDHTDVTITSVTDGQTLCYDDATSMWVNVDKETNKCCLPDPGGLSVLDPVYIDPVTGAVTPSDISDPNSVAQYVVVEVAGGEVCIQDFGVVDLGAPHGFPVGECVYEDAAGGTTTTTPTTGINNVLFHAIDANKVSIAAGTRAYEIGQPAGTDLDDLENVSCPAPNDGDTICYNAATSQFECQPKANSFTGFSARSDSTTITGGSLQTISYGTVDHDTDSGFSTGANSYTIPTTGYWKLEAYLQDADFANSDNSAEILITVNGNIEFFGGLGNEGTASTGSNSRNTVRAGGQILLNAGDVVTVQMFSTNNFDVEGADGNKRNRFFGCLLGV